MILVVDTYHKDFGGEEKYYLFENRSLFEIFEKENYGDYKVIDIELIKNRNQINDMKKSKEIKEISDKLSPEEREKLFKLLGK